MKKTTSRENKNRLSLKTAKESAQEKTTRKTVKSVRKAGSEGKKEKKKDGSRLRIIPLGGLEQIGMNMTVFEYEDSIFVVDCGLAFPEDDMFGIDMVIPDVTYLEENIEKVKGFVITHGHEDHIGALPYILKKINVPVYATRLTMGIIENKLIEHGMMEVTSRTVVSFGQTITLGQFRVEFIKTNHSIVDAAALAIYTPVGTVIHTGDFKVDYTPVFGDAIDLQRFAELGRQGVLALMCDSTNAERPGYTPSERTVGVKIDRIFSEHTDTRIIISTFASNVDRVQQIINSAKKFGRKVVIEGRSMSNVIETASSLGCLNIPEKTLIDVEELHNYPASKTVIITTGSQGESMAALTRMAEDTHRRIKIGPGDTIIFSSHPIPGNEKSVTNVVNKLLRKGAEVIVDEDVHVSGHPCQEELKLIYSLVQPKFAIPIHGEYRHLIAQAKVAKSLQVPAKNIFILQSGNVLELTGDRAKMADDVHTGAILVDGLGVGDVGNAVLRDRQRLAEDGIVIVAFGIDGDGRFPGNVEIESRGFVYMKEAEVLMNEAEVVAEDTIRRSLQGSGTDNARIRTAVRDALGDFFWKKTKRKPTILPIIVEI